MKTMKFGIGLLVSGLMTVSPCSGQTDQDYIIASRAFEYLRKANRANGVTIGFGLASNIEMIALGGFPLEVDYGSNPGANLSHMALALGRVISVPFPAARLVKARDILEPWRTSPEMASSCKKLFKNLDAAQVLTAAAPLLTVAGGVMMFVASTNLTYDDSHPGDYDSHYQVANKGLKTAGWIFVGAGLAASFSSAILVNISKKELAAKMGSFQLKAGPGTVGLQYNLPGASGRVDM